MHLTTISIQNKMFYDPSTRTTSNTFVGTPTAYKFSSEYNLAIFNFTLRDQSEVQLKIPVNRYGYYLISLILMGHQETPMTITLDPNKTTAYQDDAPLKPMPISFRDSHQFMIDALQYLLQL